MRSGKLISFSVLISLLVISSLCGATTRLPQVQVDVSVDKVIAGAPSGVFGYSGNIWLVPKVFDLLVAGKILQMDNLGIVRIGLGDAILSHASSMQDLKNRLNDFRLNDFLKQYKKRGGKVLIILDAVPMWASSNKTRKRKGHQEKFRLSPPADYKEWSRIVSTIVRHFNGKLGLDAYYEVWNEPDNDFLGTNEEYLKLYYHSAVGVKKADKSAKIGGPGVSDYSGTKTAGDKLRTEILQPPMMFEWLLEYTSRTPVPELGLKRVPVDFISWHSYYRNPGAVYKVIVPYLRKLLANKGYPRTTPLLITEWNIASAPPYPEGDLNATDVGAAFAASTLISMHEAGVDGQVFQLFVDPGTKGYSGGTFTTKGLPRANYNTFKLFSKLKGRQIDSGSSDEWVKSVAYTDGQRVYLLVSVMLPTKKMMGKEFSLRRRILNEDLLRSAPKTVTRRDIAAYMKKGKALPEPLHSNLGAVLKSEKSRLNDYRQKSMAWKNGIRLNINLRGLQGRPGKITHYKIDAKHSNGSGDIQKAVEQLVRKNRATMKNATVRLDKLGVREQGKKAFFNEIKSSGNIRRILDRLPKQKRDKVRDVYEKMAAEISNNAQGVMNRESARLYKEELSWPSSGKLALDSKPYSVQLFVFEK